MATAEERAELRLRLSEEIPDDGVAGDTLFDEGELDTIIDEAGSVSEALGEGWRRKAERLSNLTKVTEGSSSRDLSALAKNALNIAKLHGVGDPPPTPAVPTRIGKIKRTGFQG